MNSERQFQIIDRKLSQLEKLAGIRSNSMPQSSDTIILMRFCLSLERQIRQLRADFNNRLQTENEKK